MLNFMGIGAQKSATTWLYNTLLNHERIAFPMGKEVHFWDRYYDRGYEWYEKAFCDDCFINGDITPAYGHLPADRISEIHARMPHLKLIYLIRNPIDRAWSFAKMDLLNSKMSIDKTPDEWFVDHFRSVESIARGDYEANIRRWRSLFQSDRLFIIKYESICSDPVSVANLCLRHIGLDAIFSEKDKSQLLQKIFEGDGTLLRSSLRPVLMEIYEQKIMSLGQYMDEDFSAWIK